MKTKITIKSTKESSAKVRTCQICGKKFYNNHLYDCFKHDALVFGKQHNSCMECRVIKDIPNYDIPEEDKKNIAEIIKYSRMGWIVDNDGSFEKRLVMPVSTESGRKWYLDVVDGTHNPKNALIENPPDDWVEMYSEYLREKLPEFDFDEAELNTLTDDELSLIDNDLWKFRFLVDSLTDDEKECYEWKCPKCETEYSTNGKKKFMRYPECETPLVML